MLLGLALLYVGAVLFLNGLWLMGKIGDNEISIINIFSGVLTFLIAMYLAFGPGADANSIKAAGLTLLFTFTYLWVAFNRYSGADGRGLGWFSLFVAITVVPVAISDARFGLDRLGCLVRALLGRLGGALVHVFPAARPEEADRLGDRVWSRLSKACSPAGCQAIFCWTA